MSVSAVHDARASSPQGLAHIYLNRFELVQQAPTRALAHALRGEMEEALAIGGCVEALLLAGSYDEVLQHRYTLPNDYAAALRGQGRIEEAAARGDGRALCQLDAGPEALASPLVLQERLYVLQHLALRSYIRGDLPEYLRHAAAAADTPCAADWGDVWLPRYLLLPILEQEAGHAGAFERSARRVITDFPVHWHAKGFHLSRFVLGEISLADFESQPVLRPHAKEHVSRGIEGAHDAKLLMGRRGGSGFLSHW